MDKFEGELKEPIREIRVGVKYTEDGVKKQKIKIQYKQTCYVDYFEGVGSVFSNDLRTVFQAPDDQADLKLPKVG